jgi:hypothetical protein
MRQATPWANALGNLNEAMFSADKHAGMPRPRAVTGRVNRCNFQRREKGGARLL